jgi:hypothetical protein
MANTKAHLYANHQDDLGSPADAFVNWRAISRGPGVGLLAGLNGGNRSGRVTFGSSQQTLDANTYPPIYPELSRNPSRLKLFGSPQVPSSSFDESPPSSFSYSSNPLPSSSADVYSLFQLPPRADSVAVPIQATHTEDLAADTSLLGTLKPSAQIIRQSTVHPSRQLCPERSEEQQPKIETSKQQQEQQPKLKAQGPGKSKEEHVVQAGTAPAAQALGIDNVVGGFAKVPYRPMLGEVECSCPMICVMELHKGSWRAVPLPTHSLQYKAYCHISQVFVDLQLLCSYPEVSS